MTDSSEVRYGEQLTSRQERTRAALTCGPGLGWLVVFLVIPLLVILICSFLERSVYGEVQWSLTLANFKRLAGFGTFGFDPLYLRVILQSLWLAAGTAALCLLASLPLAFFISSLSPGAKQGALILVVIPFWTNLLIRTYAWQILLSGTGLPAQLAAAAGLLAPGQALFPSTFAVFLGLACDYLPFMVLPLYASVEKIDWSIAEAASDLGANGPQVFRHALLPQLMPGLIAGTILVFVPATGQFVIPDLLGGGKTVLLGNAIQQQFGPSRDWPFGSAIASVAMVLVLAGLWIYARTVASEGEEALV
jgi:spermidine/putrescine transport system permease protein